MRIHKEGKSTVAIATLIMLVINGPLIYSNPKGIITISVLIATSIVYGILVHFFRSPERIYNGNLNRIVVAPTDGKVVVVEKVFEKEYFNDYRIQVSIFMNIFNAHSNWIPTDGKIIHSSYQKGRFMSAYLPKSSTENERSTIVIETPCKEVVLTRQIAGAIARRIVTYVNEGQECALGDPLGFIKFGSRMDLFLPLDSEIDVKIGDNVLANISLVAKLPKHKG